MGMNTELTKNKSEHRSWHLSERSERGNDSGRSFVPPQGARSFMRCAPLRGAPASPRLRLGLPDAGRFAPGFRPAAGLTQGIACGVNLPTTYESRGARILRGYARSTI